MGTDIMAYRKNNWPYLLNKMVEIKKDLPFAWGENDCCLFSADFVFAITGYDPAAEFRGSYKSYISAERIIKKHGGIEVLADKMLSPLSGFRCKPFMSARGDVVSVRLTGGRMALGINYGRYAIFAGSDKMEIIPIEKAISAWGIV